MTKSLLIGLLLLTSAASASAQLGPVNYAGGPYQWLKQTTATVPVNAVKAPPADGRSMVACKGMDGNNLWWGGYLLIVNPNNITTVYCYSRDALGGSVITSGNVYVLVTTNGATPTWKQGPAKPWFYTLGTLPPNVINVANVMAQTLCAKGGYVGWTDTANDTCGLREFDGFSYSWYTYVLTW